MANVILGVTISLDGFAEDQQGERRSALPGLRCFEKQ